VAEKKAATTVAKISADGEPEPTNCILLKAQDNHPSVTCRVQTVDENANNSVDIFGCRVCCANMNRYNL